MIYVVLRWGEPPQRQLSERRLRPATQYSFDNLPLVARRQLYYKVPIGRIPWAKKLAERPRL